MRLQRLPVQAAESRHLGEHVVAQRRPVERGAGELPAEASRILQVFREVRAVDEQLLRHATAYDAGAADLVLLDDGNFGAVPRSDARGTHAARAGADDQQVEVEWCTHKWATFSPNAYTRSTDFEL